MESILSYTVIILVIVISIYIYNIRKKQSRIFSLSEQNFPSNIFYVKIAKLNGVITSILIEIYALKDMNITSVRAELITGKRVFNYYDISGLCNNLDLPLDLTASHSCKIEIPFTDFKNKMNDGELPFRTFRFVINDDRNNPFKSHELGFNSKWIIYRPDTGSYN
ncbi:MAG: hypothetical protein P8J47_03735 [Bacteroidales bacterium]|nr:hypothetical protein [Bacteroidales bacterium]